MAHQGRYDSCPNPNCESPEWIVDEKILQECFSCGWPDTDNKGNMQDDLNELDLLK